MEVRAGEQEIRLERPGGGQITESLGNHDKWSSYCETMKDLKQGRDIRQPAL